MLQEAASSLQTIESSFLSAGLRCACTLHLPSQVSRPPAILLVHGWGATQKTLTREFCEQFAQAGFATLTFDYRSWGGSEGQPRQVIWAGQRVQDVEAALAHLKTLPQIDASRIVLWGSSLGGGHAIDVAAQHPELMGVIAQVPMLDGLAAAMASPWLKTLRFSAYAMVDLLLRGRRPLYIPVVAPPGQWGTMDRDDAYEVVMRGTQAGEPYDNRVAARSVLTLLPYRPFKRLTSVRVPTLIIGAKQDTVAPFVESKVRAAQNPNLRIETIPGHHFDPYVEPTFSRNVQLQLDFLRGLSAPRRSA